MKILILLTGGTFGSFKNQNNVLDVVKFQEIKKTLHELLTPIHDVQLKIVSPFTILSENVMPIHWEKLVNLLNNELNQEKFDGVLIVHGTDTMAYTTSALSYVEDLSKKYPIVVTGANYPLFYQETDAKINLLDSINALTYFIKNNIKGVFLVFNGSNKNVTSKIHIGTKVKKDKWEDSCYRSLYIGKESIGKIYQKKIEFDIGLYKNLFVSQKRYKNLTIKFNHDQTAFLKIHPGLDPNILNLLFENGKRYFVLEIYNSGTAPAGDFPLALDSIIETISINNGLVFAISQHEGGLGVKMNIYASSSVLKNKGLIPLNDMIWEACVPKLMLASANFENNEDIVKYMQTNIAGEIRDGL